MTRAELLEVVYRFYPRGLPEYDPAYAISEERRRLAEAARRAASEYPTWKALIRRLGDRHSLQNESMFLVAGGVDPAYSARIWLPGDSALTFHVCFLGPYYGVHRTGVPGEELVASEIAREIEATYPGYQPVPPELGNEVVPDVDGPRPLGEATIYTCLFSEVWEWIVVPFTLPHTQHVSFSGLLAIGPFPATSGAITVTMAVDWDSPQGRALPYGVTPMGQAPSIGGFTDDLGRVMFTPSSEPQTHTWAASARQYNLMLDVPERAEHCKLVGSITITSP